MLYEYIKHKNYLMKLFRVNCFVCFCFLILSIQTTVFRQYSIVFKQLTLKAFLPELLHFLCREVEIWPR